ncbi:LysR substrate-binding domain-containing protein [Sphingomonas crocodyli]|uniref:LysR family transcriptional regulator n=1 Tax=Sphingomonas crocodyli TaxID=1979270 RepID=A0A437M7A6_9SPHN|nr:LysR substrate-binding domain-containing protein [Sphingomonas crocodyli]RVT93517.1 LysR family transcriptional regulator [Sphingomonas crocodyli]
MQHINLRQIEAFKAVIETGTISRAAQLMGISQPGMSKAIAHLEEDTQLQLFDRSKGRLAPTEQGMRLYREVEQIFAGVRQVENAVEVIRREEKGQLSIGVMPALSGDFVQRATTNFLASRPHVFCSVETLGSQWTVDRIASRKLDIGLIDSGLEHPYLITEPIMVHPIVCIMPLGSPLAEKRVITPSDLEGVPFLAPDPARIFGHQIQRMFQEHDVRPKNVLAANALQTMCGFVAEGLGVSLVHPLVISGMRDRVIVRRFEPEILFHFVMCRSADNRNAMLVEEFATHVRALAAEASLATSEMV